MSTFQDPRDRVAPIRPDEDLGEETEVLNPGQAVAPQGQDPQQKKAMPSVPAAGQGPTGIPTPAPAPQEGGIESFRGVISKKKPLAPAPQTQLTQEPKPTPSSVSNAAVRGTPAFAKKFDRAISDEKIRVALEKGIPIRDSDSIEIPMARQKELEDAITGAMNQVDDNFLDTFSRFMEDVGEATHEAGKTALFTAPEALFSWVPNGATNAANYVNSVSVSLSNDTKRKEDLARRYAAQEKLRDEAALRKMSPEEIKQLIDDASLETTDVEKFFTDTTGKLSVYSLLPKDSQESIRAQQALNPSATAATEVLGQIVQYAPTPWGGAFGAVAKSASVPGLLTRGAERILKMGAEVAATKAIKPFSASKFGVGLNRMLSSDVFKPVRAVKATRVGKFLSKVADLNMTDLASNGISSALVDSLFGDAKSSATERMWNGMVMGMMGYTGYKWAENVTRLYSNKFIFSKLPDEARRQIQNGDDLIKVLAKHGVSRLHPMVAKTLSVGLESIGNAWVDTGELMKAMSVIYNQDQYTDEQYQQAKDRLVGIVGGSFLGTIWGRVGNRPVWADYIQRNPELADNNLYLHEIEAREAKRLQDYESKIAKTNEEILSLRRNIRPGADPADINVEYTKSLVRDIERSIGVNDWMDSQGAGNLGVTRLVNAAQEGAANYTQMAFSRAVQGGPIGDDLKLAREQGMTKIEETFSDLYREMDADLGAKLANKSISAGEEAKLRQQGIAALGLARDKAKALLDAGIDRGIMDLFNRHQQAQMQLAESQRIIDENTQAARETILGTALSGMTPEQRSRLGSDALVGHQTTIFGAGAKMVDRMFSTQWRNQFQVEGVDKPWSARKFSREADSSIDAATATAVEEVNTRYNKLEKDTGESLQAERDAELRAVQDSAAAAKDFFSQAMRDQTSDMRARWDHARGQIATAQGVTIDELGKSGKVAAKIQELRDLRAKETDSAKIKQIDAEIAVQRETLKGAEAALKRFVDAEDLIRSTGMETLRQMQDEANQRISRQHQEWQADQQKQLDMAEASKKATEIAYQQAKLRASQGMPEGEDETKAFTALTKHGGWLATLRDPKTGFIMYYPNGGKHRLFVRGAGDNFEVMLNKDILGMFGELELPPYLIEAADALKGTKESKLESKLTASLTGDDAHRLISDLNYMMMANQMRGHATFTMNGINPMNPVGGGVYELDGRSYIRGADGVYRSKWHAQGQAREEKLFDRTLAAEAMVAKVANLEQQMRQEQDPERQQQISKDLAAMNEALAKERAEISKLVEAEPKDQAVVGFDPGMYEPIERQFKDPPGWNRHAESNPVVKMWIRFVTQDLRGVAESDDSESLLPAFESIKAAMDLALRSKENDSYVVEMIKFMESMPDPVSFMKQSGMDGGEMVHRLAMEMAAIGMGRGNADSSFAKLVQIAQQNQRAMEQEGIIRQVPKEEAAKPPQEPPEEAGGTPVEPTPKPTEGPAGAAQKPPAEAPAEGAAKPKAKRTRKSKTPQGDLPFTSMTDLVDAKPPQSALEDKPSWQMDINEFMQKQIGNEVDPQAEAEFTKFYYQNVLRAAAEGKPVNPEFVREAEGMVESGEIEAPAGYKSAKKKTVVGLEQEVEQGPELTPEERKRRATYPIAAHNVTASLARKLTTEGIYSDDLKSGDINLTHNGKDLYEVLNNMKVDAESPENKDIGEDISMRVDVEIDGNKEEDIFVERINGQWSMRSASDTEGKNRRVFATQRPFVDLAANKITSGVIRPAIDKVLGIKENAKLTRRPLRHMVVVPDGENVNPILKILRDNSHPIRETVSDDKGQKQKAVDIDRVVQELGTVNDDGSDVVFEIANLNQTGWNRSDRQVKNVVFPRVLLQRVNGQWSVKPLQGGRAVPLDLPGGTPLNAPAVKPSKTRVVKGRPGDPELGGTMIFDPIEWQKAAKRAGAKSAEVIKYVANRAVQFFGSDAEFVKNIDPDTGHRLEMLHDDDRRVRGELHYQAMQIIRDIDALPNRDVVRNFAQERVMDPNSNSFLSRLQMAVEGIPFPDGAKAPPGFEKMVDGYRQMFYESGRFLEEAGLVMKFADGNLGRFTANSNRHRFIRMMTPEFYDTINRSPEHPEFKALIEAMAQGNAKSVEETRNDFRAKNGVDPSDAQVDAARQTEVDELKAKFTKMFRPDASKSRDPLSGERTEATPLERTTAADFARTLKFFPTTIRVKDPLGGPDQDINILADDFDSIINRIADETGLRYGVVNNFGNDITPAEAQAISNKDPSARPILSMATVYERFDQAIKASGSTSYDRRSLSNVLRRVQDISTGSFVDVRGKAARTLLAAEGERRMAELGVSSLANLVEPIGSLPGFVGSKRTFQALKRTLDSLAEYSTGKSAVFEVREAAIRNGAIMTGVSTRLFDTNRFSGKTMQTLRAIVSGGFEHTQQFAEMWAAEAGRVTVESWKQGRFTKMDEFMLKQLGFNQAEINAFKTGNFSPKLEKGFIGRLSGAATATQTTTRRSYFTSNKWLNLALPFNRYYLGRMKMGARMLIEAAKADTPEQRLAAANSVGQWAFGTAVAGTLATFIMQSVYTMDPMEVAYKMYRQAVGAPGDSIAQKVGNLTSFAGKMIVSQTVAGPAIGGGAAMFDPGQPITGVLRPVVLVDYLMAAKDIFDGTGPYRGMGAWEKVGTALERATPLSKAGARLISSFTVSELAYDVTRILNDVRELERENKETYLISGATPEEKVEFNNAVRKLVDDFRKGRNGLDPASPEVMDRIDEALKLGIGSDLRRSILSMRNMTGQDLDAELRTKVLDRIGQENYDKLMDYDRAIEDLANSVPLYKGELPEDRGDFTERLSQAKRLWEHDDFTTLDNIKSDVMFLAVRDLADSGGTKIRPKSEMALQQLARALAAYPNALPGAIGERDATKMVKQGAVRVDLIYRSLRKDAADTAEKERERRSAARNR